MKHLALISRQWFMLIAVIFAAFPAHAAITCGPMAASSINFAFVSGTNSASSNNFVSNSITVQCQRSAASDSTVLSLGADNGLYNTTGMTNNARLVSGGTNFDIRYDVWRNSLCASSSGLRWRDNNAAGRITASFVGTALNTPETLTFNYWGCIPSQGVSINSFPPGVYTDQIITTLRAVQAGADLLISTGIINVNIYAPASCSITGLASANTIVFNYTAFGPADFKFATFNANCTNLLPYTMSLTPANGVVGGLKYQLGLSNAQGSTTNIGPASLGSIGGSTGMKVHYINAVMDAGQAGTAGAITPQSHTLMITY
jgi:hypothetical protein